MSTMSERHMEQMPEEPETPFTGQEWHELVNGCTHAAWQNSNRVICYTDLYHMTESVLRSAMPTVAPEIVG